MTEPTKKEMPWTTVEEEFGLVSSTSNCQRIVIDPDEAQALWDGVRKALNLFAMLWHLKTDDGSMLTLRVSRRDAEDLIALLRKGIGDE